jgi:hypothetical protein
LLLTCVHTSIRKKKQWIHEVIDGDEIKADKKHKLRTEKVEPKDDEDDEP